jgi:hypothetical protein
VYDTMLTCAVTKGTFSGCGKSGKPILNGCQNEVLAYFHCIFLSMKKLDASTE